MQSYHEYVWEFVVLIVLLGALVLLAAPWLRRTRSGESGTLLITGVSPRPDAAGEQYVTVAGVINGPSVNEHEVYGRVAIDVANWPAVGQLVPVVYSPKNPDNWNFAPHASQP
ncbi:hypothetical protein MAUB_14530 [Mycolicibacterium aubagnense]|uniref:DUF3592 domain-containing protein n=1 Tax=Mycolicibacterium aubagnense TaxID=319707 RepID=A0ABM7IAD4_9MYCO|nr:hypothetical protein MAUB_14530 [Mycolicibacterium aubagnense]